MIRGRRALPVAALLFVVVGAATVGLAAGKRSPSVEVPEAFAESFSELAGKADYVMANPPFNVDEIDADKVKTDSRLSFGLPGTNKKGKVSSGNYVRSATFTAT